MLRLGRAMPAVSALAACLLGSPPARPAGYPEALYQEVLDLVPDPYSTNAYILEAHRVAGPGPELTEADVYQNPSGFSGALTVDLDPLTDLLFLTPTKAQCYSYAEVTILLPFTGVRILSSAAIANASQADPNFLQEIEFGTGGDGFSLGMYVYRENCGLVFSSSGESIYQLNPTPVSDDGTAAANGSFSEFLLTAASTASTTERVLRNTTAVGAGPELGEANEVSNPAGLQGSVSVDLDPKTGIVTLTPSEPMSCYTFIGVYGNLTLADPRRRIVGLSLLNAGVFDASITRFMTLEASEFGVKFASGSSAPCLTPTGLSDTYQIMTLEPEGDLSTAMSFVALVCLGCSRRSGPARRPSHAGGSL